MVIAFKQRDFDQRNRTLLCKRYFFQRSTQIAHSCCNIDASRNCHLHTCFQYVKELLLKKTKLEKNVAIHLRARGINIKKYILFF